MNQEPNVLSELRAWRDEFARQHGYNVTAMAATLRNLDQQAGDAVISTPPRTPSKEINKVELSAP